MTLWKLALGCLLLLSTSALAYNNKLELKYGIDKSGNSNGHWIAYDPKTGLMSTKYDEKLSKKLTLQETQWADLIASRLTTWASRLDTIAIPFSKTKPIRQVTIVLGNVGDRDAFAHPTVYPQHVFFNLSKLESNYGSALLDKNKVRIDRFFAHEYTHLLQHRRSLKSPYPLDSYVEQALTIAYKEGFGHFHSISDKWKDQSGGITPHALEKLAVLEVEFVKRMVALKSANEQEAAMLMQGISTGRFDKKWGALTVALWLTKEANGNDSLLVKWVDSGPRGLMLLADKHLPDHLGSLLKQEFEAL